MGKGLVDMAMRHPRWVFVLTAAITLLLGAQMPRIQIDTDPENMLPADQPDRVFHNEVKRRFGLHDAIVVGAVNEDGIYNQRSLSALHALTEGILQIEGVVRPDVMSLATVDNISQAGPGTIRFEWMMREPPATEAEADAIGEKVARLPLMVDTLVSADGRAAAVYVPIESKDESHRIAREIRDIADGLETADAYHITGLPVAEDTFGFEMFVQMGISAPLAGLMIFLLMWWFFRNVPLILGAMIVAIVTVVATMGLLIGFGFTVHIMSSMIPIFLMPIAVVDSVHILSEFADLHSSGRKPRETMREVVGHLFKPMLYTSITSAVGFASLALTPIPPVQIFGLFVAFGILLAFILTIVLLPAYVELLKPETLARMKLAESADAGAHTPLGRALRALGGWSVRNAKLLIFGFAVLFALSVVGITRIEINDNPVRWFKADHRIRVADRVLNEHFAGTYDAYLVLEREDTEALLGGFRREADELLAAIEAEGESVAAARSALDDALGEAGGTTALFETVVTRADDALFAADDAEFEALDRLIALAERYQSASKYFQSPEALAWIESLQAAMAENGFVGKTNALPDLVKTVNRELRSGEPADFEVPETQRGVAQTLLQFQSSHRPQDLWHMVTPDYRSTAIWLQLTSGDNQDMTRVERAVDAYLADNPPPADVEVSWAGKTYINVVWQDAMVAGMVKSLIGAFVTVFVMMLVLFRSLPLAVLAMLPLTVTITFIYGLIGWIGKDYDMPIAVLSALTLGLSIDFAIHFIERSRDLAGRFPSFDDVMRAMFEEPARAIARNAIVIAVGFTPLLFAPLVPYVTVGIFLASIMAVSGVVTLAVLPAVMSVAMRRRFTADRPPQPQRPSESAFTETTT